MLEENRNDNLYTNLIPSQKIDGIILVRKNREITAIDETQGEEYFKNKTIISSQKKHQNYFSIFIAFIMVFIFALMPIKILNSSSNLKALASDSYNKMNSAIEFLNKKQFDEAKKEFIAINENVKRMNVNLKDIGQKNYFITRFLPTNNASIQNEKIFDVVYSLSEIGRSLIDDLSYFEGIQINDINSNNDNKELFSKIKILNQKLKYLEPQIKTLKENIYSIKEDSINDNELKYIKTLKDRFGEIENYYNQAINVTEFMPSILGEDYDKKYLVLFENNNEIRATGGFIGTYGIVTLRDAKIKNIFIDSIYNPDGQITKKIDPPEPLKMVTNSLTMRDANWNPDFKYSAKQISDLYEIEGGFTPDGVVAIDTKPFLDLLGITGPINLEKYGTEINKDNFVATTQFKTSYDYDPDANNPKKFLADFAPLFLEKILAGDKESQQNILNAILANIKEKHILFYSPEEKIENTITNFNIGGGIYQANKDYFLYVNSNLGGLKTSQEIQESMNHQITVLSDGSIEHNVILERKHNGEYSWTSGINYSYMRFYLPKGSVVTDVKGFEKKDSMKKEPTTGMVHLEDDLQKYLGKAGINDLDIYEENGKTVIGVWQVIKPGEDLTSEITYRLPLKINLLNPINNYDIFIQKQPGIIEQLTKISVKDKTGNSIYNYSFPLTKDVHINVSK